jgi:uncharacterized protein
MHGEITFDPLKDAMNCIRHGISLGMAREIDWRVSTRWVDKRRDYGEVREVGLVTLCGRIHCIVFTRRNGALRVISLRRANDREILKYERDTGQIRTQHAGGGSGDSAGDCTGPGHGRPFGSKHRLETFRLAFE